MELPVFESLHTAKGIAPQLGESMGRILGIPYAMFEESMRAIDAIRAGRSDRAAESVAPKFLKNIVMAIRLSTEGETTISGTPINVPGEVVPLKITPYEAATRTIGFQPLRLMKASEIHQIITGATAYRDEKETELANRYMAAYRKDDNKEMVAVRNEMMAWNRTAVTEGRPEMRITLEHAIHSRVKARQPLKQMRGLGREVREVYGL